jgi:hypothetical protein
MSEPVARPEQAVDFLGKEIKAGSIICYPVRRGSSMWLKKLTVSAVRDSSRGAQVSGTNDAGRRINIHNLSNCVVVEG